MTDKKSNFYNKNYMDTQDVKYGTLEFLQNRSRRAVQIQYPYSGVFYGGKLSSQTNDQITASAGHGVNFYGDWILWELQQNVDFPNTNATTYNIGIKYGELLDQVEQAVTGQVEYKYIKEVIGEIGNPDTVYDDGNDTNITIVVDGLFEAAEDHSGRTVRVILTQPQSTTDWYEDLAVSYGTDARWVGSKNYVQTAGKLGQAAISETVTDYICWAKGLTIVTDAHATKDPSTDQAYIFLGTCDGNNGGVPSNITDTRNILQRLDDHYEGTFPEAGILAHELLDLDIYNYAFPNYTRNPSFEAWTGGEPDDWDKVEDSPGTITQTPAVDMKGFPTKDCVLWDANGAAATITMTLTHEEYKEVREASYVCISCKIRDASQVEGGGNPTFDGSAGDRFRLKILFYDANGTQLTGGDGEITVAEETSLPLCWAISWGSVVVPDGAVFSKERMELETARDIVVYTDDFKFEYSKSVTQWVPWLYEWNKTDYAEPVTWGTTLSTTTCVETTTTVATTESATDTESTTDTGTTSSQSSTTTWPYDPPTKCVVGDTDIAVGYDLESGEIINKKIRDIKVGDAVLVYNEDEAKIDISRVTGKTSKGGVTGFCYLNNLQCTPNHRAFMSNTKQWVESNHFHSGDMTLGLEIRDDKLMTTVFPVVYKHANMVKPRIVYNLEIEGHHNFFANNILVHNVKVTRID